MVVVVVVVVATAATDIVDATRCLVWRLRAPVDLGVRGMRHRTLRGGCGGGSLLVAAQHRRRRRHGETRLLLISSMVVIMVPGGILDMSRAVMRGADLVVLQLEANCLGHGSRRDPRHADVAGRVVQDATIEGTRSERPRRYLSHQLVLPLGPRHGTHARGGFRPPFRLQDRRLRDGESRRSRGLAIGMRRKRS